METFRGPGPDSEFADMSTHHRCAFSVTVLGRLAARGDEEACSRLLDHYDYSGRENYLARGAHAGGEFLGLALCQCVGIGKWGLEPAPDRQAKFLRLKGALAVLSSELLQSGDADGVLQQALASVPKSVWRQACPQEVAHVLRHYGEYRSHIPAILGHSAVFYRVLTRATPTPQLSMDWTATWPACELTTITTAWSTTPQFWPTYSMVRIHPHIHP